MRDVRDMCKEQGGDAPSKTFPELPKSVRGDTDILIGIKYFPVLIHMFPTVLAVYRCALSNSDGSGGVVAGPILNSPEQRNHKKALMQVNLSIIAPQPNNIGIGVELKAKCRC